MEGLLAAYFSQHNPEVIGNDYLVIGTLDRPDWQQGTASPMAIAEIFDHFHDFRDVVTFRPVGGWQPADRRAERWSGKRGTA